MINKKLENLNRQNFSRKNFGGQEKTQGYLLIQVLVFGSIGVMIVGALIGWGNTAFKLSDFLVARERAFQVAEAGIDYYRWHLAHSPKDFQDGTATSGPYIHIFEDKLGNQIGKFTLNIIPPMVGSTIVTVQSNGLIDGYPNVKRTIEAKYAIPSLAKYAFVANSAMRFGEGTEVFGPIHSNGGIRFDGLAHNLVTSAQASYHDPDQDTGLEYGVHTHKLPVDTFPPTSVPSRTDVFATGRQFPVPAVDFTGFTADLAQIKADAKTAGKYFASSGGLGYRVLLKIDKTFDLYKVNSFTSVDRNCTNSGNQTGWGSWSVDRETKIGNYPFPVNGLIFLEDNVWVEGKINESRLTIASGVFPESANTNTSITVNKDLLYTNYDGRDVLSLIAQNNINVGLFSDDDLEIDGALVAKTGRVGRYYYTSSCGSSYKRSKLTLFGMIATNLRYGFAYTDGTGYNVRNITYDGNMLYGPPPSFPLTSDKYQILSWREI